MFCGFVASVFDDGGFSSQEQTPFEATPVPHIILSVYSYSRWCYRKAQVVSGLQQGGHTAHGVHANKKKPWKLAARRSPAAVRGRGVC